MLELGGSSNNIFFFFQFTYEEKPSPFKVTTLSGITSTDKTRYIGELYKTIPNQKKKKEKRVTYEEIFKF